MRAVLVFLLLLWPAMAQADKFKVATTFTVIADMARNVAGDAAEVVSITRPGAEIHNYQPTPRDIIRAQGADLILWNGLNLELWFEKFFDRLSDVPAVVLTDGVAPMGIEEGPYTGKPNPHAWMSFSDALIYVTAIEAALVTHDPGNADTYRANAAAYRAEIEAARAPIPALTGAVPADRRGLGSAGGASPTVQVTDPFTVVASATSAAGPA